MSFPEYTLIISKPDFSDKVRKYQHLIYHSNWNLICYIQVAPAEAGRKKSENVQMNNLFLKLYVKSQELLNREEGQDLIEYALLAALLSLAVVAILPTLGGKLNDVFTDINTAL